MVGSVIPVPSLSVLPGPLSGKYRAFTRWIRRLFSALSASLPSVETLAGPVEFLRPSPVPAGVPVSLHLFVSRACARPRTADGTELEYFSRKK